MPVLIPSDIPAYDTLGKERITSSHDDALEILIVNLMPLKIQTENQLLDLLSNFPLKVNITLLTTDSYVGKNTPKTHLDKFYVTLKDITDRSFNGVILTGAPVDKLRYEDVAYWEELKDIFSFCAKNSKSCFYICWSAMAALYHYYGIAKTPLDKKAFGIFKHQVVNKDPLLNGLDEDVLIPHSRHVDILEQDVLSAKVALSAGSDIAESFGDLRVLLKSEDVGLGVIRNDRDFFVLGHLEYEKDTLHKEYERDINANLPIDKPRNYYVEGKPSITWRAGASIVFYNWLNYYARG